MKSQRFVVVLGLLLIDLGIFIATCAFLPKPNMFGWSGWWEYLLRSRHHWDIAGLAFLAAVICSAGIFLLLEAFGAFHPRPNRS